MGSIITVLNASLPPTSPVLTNEISQFIVAANRTYNSLSYLVNQGSTLVFNNLDFIPSQVAAGFGTDGASFFSTMQIFTQTLASLIGSTATFIPKNVLVLIQADGSAIIPITPVGNPIPP